MLVKRKKIEHRVSSIEYREMFTISIETNFWASHQLALPNGLKEPLHSHNWLVTAEVISDKLNSMAVVMNFQTLKDMVDNIVDEFGNTSLNEFSYFQKNNPSAENVAKYIYEELKPKLTKDVKLRCISVVEQPGCSARFGE